MVLEVDLRELKAASDERLLRLALDGAHLVGGGAVATGVSVEKSSRIAEVLVTTLRPAQLIAGKVLGIGASTLLLLLPATVPLRSRR